MEHHLLFEYAMITMPDIDVDDVRFGQLLVILGALSIAVLGRLAVFLF
ncbi:MAG TPA: hypothetical protein VF447_11220 [Terriglobales bacterium]